MKDERQAVISALKEEFIVTNIEKRYSGDELEIYAEFSYKGRTGKFVYTLIGRESGVDGVEDFVEEGDEDIYSEIHNWIDEHIEFKTIVKYDGKEIRLK